jgi:hypothetical protein
MNDLRRKGMPFGREFYFIPSRAEPFTGVHVTRKRGIRNPEGTPEHIWCRPAVVNKQAIPEHVATDALLGGT